MADSVDQGRSLQLPHAPGYSLSKGNIVHNALGTPWGLLLYYGDPATGQTMVFAAQPADVVQPWCKQLASGTSVVTAPSGRRVCLDLLPALTSGSFIAGGVRYTVSRSFRSVAETPPEAQSQADLLSIISTVH